MEYNLSHLPFKGESGRAGPALNDMASVPITCHITDTMGVTTVQTHSFPYPHLGFILSHLHPHYVIFRAARTTLNFLVYRDQYPSSKYKSIFGDVLFCYASWTVRIANLNAGPYTMFSIEIPIIQVIHCLWELVQHETNMRKEWDCMYIMHIKIHQVEGRLDVCQICARRVGSLRTSLPQLSLVNLVGS